MILLFFSKARGPILYPKNGPKMASESCPRRGTPWERLLERSWTLLEPKKVIWNRSWAVLGRPWSRKTTQHKPGYHRTGSARGLGAYKLEQPSNRQRERTSTASKASTGKHRESCRPTTIFSFRQQGRQEKPSHGRFAPALGGLRRKQHEPSKSDSRRGLL